MSRPLSTIYLVNLDFRRHLVIKISNKQLFLEFPVKEFYVKRSGTRSGRFNLRSFFLRVLQQKHFTRGTSNSSIIKYFVLRLSLYFISYSVLEFSVLFILGEKIMKIETYSWK